jgi:trans-aconitate methyltransferase
MPEVYFLSGLKNPTRSLFDFFDDTTDRTARILGALDSHGVTAVVLNHYPAFSPKPSHDLVQAIEQRYPYAINVGPYQVRWRR